MATAIWTPPAPSVLVTPAARLPPPRRRAGRAEDLRRTVLATRRPGIRRLAHLPAEHHDRQRLQAEIEPIKPNCGNCSTTPRRRTGATAGTASSPTTCSRSGPRSGPSPSSTGSSRPTTLPNAPSAAPSSTENSRSARKARTVSGSLTRPLGRHHMPNAAPLAVHLPRRTTCRPQPRRPIPRAHLTGPGMKVSKILRFPGIKSSSTGYTHNLSQAPPTVARTEATAVGISRAVRTEA